ncbi:acetyl-CoA synthetase-like protein [Hypoxylon cercidicola]|nr:acetyl-CoA synthetase-like protein [Hypoxylon cercidicola]
MAFSAEQTYGRRLLPSVVDELARTDPRKLYAAVPLTVDAADGFRDISVADIARCVDYVASWVETKFGRGSNFETMTYIGISDIRGPVVFYAAVKCGYKLLIPSPRNPPAVNVSLMDQTGNCNKLVHAAEVLPLIKPLQGLKPSMHTEAIPSFNDMLESNPQHYPYEKDFIQAKNDPVLVLHSSGSTGLPKPITITNAALAVLDKEKNLPGLPGRGKWDWSMWNFEGESRVYTIFPFFHLGGFLALAFNPILNNASPVYGPPHMLFPDANLLRNVRLHNKLRSIILPPAVIEQLLQEPDGIDLFRDVDFVVHSGAPMNPAVGDLLSKVVDLVSPFGTTETFLIPELAPPREDWAWHEWNPHFKHEMQLYDPNDGTYELVVFADESNKDTTAVYHNLPGVTEYHTKDLFTRHPDNDKLFKYYGRRDDIIVLANGEKLNPLPMEFELQSHPSLQGAIVVGNRRNYTALLIEPKSSLSLDESGRAKLLQEIWLLIEKSNFLIAGQGRIQQGKVICSVPSKPFARTGKGTIIRKLSEAAYQDEIEKVYSDSPSQQLKAVGIKLKPTLKPVYELPLVAEFVRNVIAVSFAAGATIGESEDFFAYGLDSIQTLEIVSNLKRNLREQGLESDSLAMITPRTVFRNSSIADLSRLLQGLLNDGAVPSEDSDSLSRTIETYRETLPRRSSSRVAEPPKKLKIAILGSTGYLGQHLVASLLGNPDITHIYCLNRSSDAQTRQEAALHDIIGDQEQSNLPKFTYMTASIGQPLLGLNRAEYDELAAEVDIVVYNSWRLDFGLGLRSFDPFLRTARDLVELAAVSSSRHMRIVFISSLSSVGRTALRTTAPERVVEDVRAPLDTGYAQAKFAAERILDAAARRSGVPVTVVRVCQVGGPRTGSGRGAWPDQPWLSALLRTARETRRAPSHVSRIDWVPVETAAAMTRDFVLHRPAAAGGAQVFHVYPTRPAPPWELLVDLMRERHGVTEVIPLREWVGKLRDVADPTPEDIARMPALKLLDHYEALGEGIEGVRCETARSSDASQVQVPVVDKQLLGRWLDSWGL